MNWKSAILILLLALLLSALLAVPGGRSSEEEKTRSDRPTAARRVRAPVSGRVEWSNWRDVTENGFPVSMPAVAEDPLPERVPRAREKLAEDLGGIDVAFGKRKVRRKTGHER